MVTLDLTASGGSVQTSGEIAYNADATGGRTSVQGILEVRFVEYLGVMRPGSIHLLHNNRARKARRVLLITTFNPVVHSNHNVSGLFYRYCILSSYRSVFRCAHI